MKKYICSNCSAIMKKLNKEKNDYHVPDWLCEDCGETITSLSITNIDEISTKDDWHSIGIEKT